MNRKERRERKGKTYERHQGIVCASTANLP
jgi:hypothetical protein